VLLLHGFVGSGRNLASFAARWAARNPTLRIIVPDQLGHGSSPPLPEPPTLDALADAARELLQAQAAEDALIVGHSLGGRVALRLATAKTPRVVLLDISPSPITLTDGLDAVLAVLVAAPPTAPTRDAMRTYFTAAGVSGALADWVLMNLVGTPAGLAWRTDREQLRRLNEDASARDLWADAERLRERLLCVRGAESHFVSGSDAARLAQSGAKVVTLAGAGHFLHVDLPEALLDILEEETRP
jgi:pimeloyl-ACP methyl ester carboxylesterase